MSIYLEKQHRLADPVATIGDRTYIICSQNGLFPDGWTQSHLPHEHGGVWAHPIKLLDGFWLAIENQTTGVIGWLLEADCCRVYGYYTEFDYRVGPLQITRRDVVPDGVVGASITVTVQLPPDFSDQLALLAVVRSDLRPAWLGEQAGLHDGPDTAAANAHGTQLILRDHANPWTVIVGGSTTTQALLDVTALSGFSLFQSNGQGITAALRLGLHTHSQSTLQSRLVIGGSIQSAEDALDAFSRLRIDYGELFGHKEAHYVRLAETSILTVPDERLNAAFHWSKVACQQLTMQTASHGPAVAAGLPIYPWWFGIDTEYAILPMLQAGLFDLAKASLRLLKTVSERHNADTPGRVIHELTTTGVVYNAGNLVETPLFTRAIYQTWCWSGDHAFLLEMYPFCKAGLLGYTLGQCDPDGDLCGAGRSIIETLEMHAGFECLDVACYTWEALGYLQQMATAVGDTTIVPDLAAKAATLAELIRTAWWLPAEGLFADVRATVNEVYAALQRLDDLATTPDWPAIKAQVVAAHRGFDSQLAARRTVQADVDLPWLLRHWVVLCPLEVGLATAEQAAYSFTRLRSAEFCNEWGMYLHPERHDVMSINSGLLALALARYGRIDEALQLIQPLAAALTIRTPGAISEALPADWCFLQLWSALGIVAPLVEGVLGIQPHIAQDTLHVIPNLPTGWSDAHIDRLRIGDQLIAVHVQRDPDPVTYSVAVTGLAATTTLHLGLYLPLTAQVESVLLNGQPIPWAWQTINGARYLSCTTHGAATLVVRLLSHPS